jgi:hypothetical protein
MPLPLSLFHTKKPHLPLSCSKHNHLVGDVPQGETISGNSDAAEANISWNVCREDRHNYWHDISTWKVSSRHLHRRQAAFGEETLAVFPFHFACRDSGDRQRAISLNSLCQHYSLHFSFSERGIDGAVRWITSPFPEPNRFGLDVFSQSYRRPADLCFRFCQRILDGKNERYPDQKR